MITAHPKEIADILTNPGMGWTTFYSFNDDEINATYPRSSIAYFRLYWADLEPEEEEYRWDLIDELIAKGRDQGQTLALRVAAMDGMEWASMWRERMLNSGAIQYMQPGGLPASGGCKRIQGDPVVNSGAQPYGRNCHTPAWFRRTGCRGADFANPAWPEGTPPLWEPDYGDPIFLEKHGRFMAALGERYDGHPGIDHIDVGSVGRWGEWHCAVVPHPSVAARRRVIDDYLAAFPKTPLVIPIGDLEALAYSVQRGIGWRADCLGDWRQDFFNPDWEGGTPAFNHMEDIFLQRLVGAKALKAWKQSLVAFESCWSMEHWQEQGWPVHCIFDYALALHCSVMNNKSRPIPEVWQPEVEEFTRRMGYRFILKSLEHPSIVHRNQSFPVSMVWENKGVAPCYRNHILALRFEQLDGGSSVVCPLNVDPKTWLPGRNIVQETITVPKNLPEGEVRISVAILDPATQRPAIRLAIEGRLEDGWYPVSYARME